MAETLPTPDPRVSYGDFASFVRQNGLSSTVKSYVTEISGNEQIYDDLAAQGLTDFQIANDFFRLEKLDPTFIEKERREGLDLRQSANLLAQDMGLDLETLREEQGFSTADFLEFFTSGRRPSPAEAAAETVASGVISGGSIAAGFGLGAAAGAMTPIPGGTLIGGLIGAGGFGLLGEEVKEEVLPQEPIIEPGMRPMMVFGETLIEALMGTTLLRGGKELQEFAFDKVGDEFKNRGFFAEKLRENAAGRSFNVVKQEMFRPNAINPEQMERYITRIAKDDPVLFAYLRSYMRNPRATLVAESAGGVGAAAGAMAAERFFPGDPGVRAVFEITGATPLSYLTMFPYFVVAKDSLKQGAEAMQGAMSVEEQQERVGQALINFMQEMGDDPQNFINAIEAGSFRRIVDDTLEAHDAAYGDLSVDQIADLPTTTRMLASLDSNDLSENASLDLLEAAILRKVPLEAQKFSNQYREQSKRIQSLIGAVIASGENADVLKTAGLMRQKLFEDTINARLEQAISDQTRVINTFGTGSSSAAARREAGKKLDLIMEGAFKDIRDQQKQLYDQIPKDLQIGSTNLLAAIKDLSADLPPEARAEIIPAMARGTQKRFADIARKARLESDIQSLETDLTELKSYQGYVLDGGPLQGTSRQTPPEVKNRLEQKYDLRFDQVEKEIKDRLGVAQEANEKLGDVDDTPLTRAQMSSYRSIMLGEAREAGAAGKNELARIYSTIADGIEKDFADVKTITELNDIPDYEQGKLVLQIDAANAFTRSFKDAFARSFPNKLQKERRTGEAIVNPELLYKEIVRGGTPEQDIKMEQISDAVTFLERSLIGDQIGGPQFAPISPEDAARIRITTEERIRTMDEAYEDIFRALARSKIVNLRGEEPEINLPALRVFIDENEDMLDQIPNLRRDLEDARTAKVALNKVLEDQKQGELPEFFTSRLFQEVTGERPAQAIESLLGPSVTNSRERFYDLLGKLRTRGAQLGEGSVTDEQIEQRLKQAVLSWARGRSIGKRPGEAFGEATDPALMGDDIAPFQALAETPNFRSMYNSLFSGVDGGPSLMSILARPGPDGEAPLFSSMERLNLQKIFKRGIELERTVLDPKFKEVIDEVTPEVDLLTGLMIKLAGSQIGTTAAKLIPGRGQGLIEAGAGVRFLEKVLAPVPSGAVDDILLQAAKDPDFMRFLLKKGLEGKPFEPGKAVQQIGKTIRQQVGEIRRLKTFLLPVLGSGIQEALTETEEEILQKQFQPFEEQRSERYQPAFETGIEPVAPPIAPPVSAAMPAPAPTAPNTQLRQRFAALYPDDPISPLIEAQGIGTLPQGRV